MTTLTDQFSELTGRTRDAVTGAVRTWADTVQSLTSGQPRLPDAHVAVDRYFDLAQQVLDGQRAVVRTVLDAGSKAAETVTTHAANVTDTGKATRAAKGSEG